MNNDTVCNISTWTVDSSAQRSLLNPLTSFSFAKRTSPQKTTAPATHRPSLSYRSHTDHDVIAVHRSNRSNNTVDVSPHHGDASKNIAMSSSSSSSNDDDDDGDGDGQDTPRTSRPHGKPDTLASPSTTTATFHDQHHHHAHMHAHPHASDKCEQVLVEEKDVEEEEEEEVASILSSPPTSSTALDAHPLTTQTLADTMDYTSKLMHTIQQMNEHSNLKYKLSKYALRSERLQRQLNDERMLHESKSTLLDKCTQELSQSNAEIERIEKEKRELKTSLTALQETQQKYRLLQMKHLQLQSEYKTKQHEIERVQKQTHDVEHKLQRTLQDRDNLSAVSENMREQLTNKQARIDRLREINHELTEKLARHSHRNDNNLNSKNHNVTLCSVYSGLGDTTTLQHDMDDLQHTVSNKLVQKMTELETKYERQSTQLRLIQVQHDNLTHKHDRLQRENRSYAEKLNAAKNALQKISDFKHKYVALQRQLQRKNVDIQRLKLAVLNLNKFVANQRNTTATADMTNISTLSLDDSVLFGIGGGGGKKEHRHHSHHHHHNVTSLSFEHDLELECGSQSVASNAKRKVSSPATHTHKATPSKTSSSSSSTSVVASSPPPSSLFRSKKRMKRVKSAPSSPVASDLLDDITEIVKNKQESSGNRKAAAAAATTNTTATQQQSGGRSRRQFLPNQSNDSRMTDSANDTHCGSMDNSLSSSEPQSKAQRIALHQKENEMHKKAMKQNMSPAMQRARV
mmetsp:Transcript_47334/g.78543  ORF Transcript_47334/g.78543 Transcript_47334/m.78543 type:complete len:743 (+) Transcript_47334:44-2272(+)